MVFDSAERAGVRKHFGYAPGAILDDHVPLANAGIPAVDIIDFRYGSVPGSNDYWHTDEDTLDKLSPESLEAVGNVVLEMLWALNDRE
jgi:Zn-dependent M28 family amino/carboxypeptidase